MLNPSELSVPPLDSRLIVAIAGNPNCGKSALFNALTGIRQTTGNWPGVTVERREGRLVLDNCETQVVDLPGIYSLDASSLDEQVTRNYLLSREAHLIVNVVDASNLERNLYLTVQLLEMDVPLVLAVNMMDVARRRGLAIDTERLAQELGCPVVPIVAVSGEGLSEIKARMVSVGLGQQAGGFFLGHAETVEQAIAALLPLINYAGHQANSRWLALKLLESDTFAQSQVNPTLLPLVTEWQQLIQARCGLEAVLHIADHRFGHAHALAQRVLRHKGRMGRTLTDRIDQVVLGRWLGIPVFLSVMYLMFVFTINIGGAFVAAFDGIGAAIFKDGFGALLHYVGAPYELIWLGADGIGGGLQVVATFIPIIACLYLFLSVLEDSGYMARAAFVMDRFMRALGLPGKAFVPLIVGFGCNVPAVMATRTLENTRERKLTLLMIPFMSCGARLPVYALFAAAFFPTNGQNLVFALYLLGISIAVLSGLIMQRTLLLGESTGFMMELPPYHLPTLRGVTLRAWDRVKLFIRQAGKVIVVMVLALNLLNALGSDWRFSHPDPEHSLLSIVGKTLTPLFAPLGIQESNWPATVGIFSGILAKEAVVGSLTSLYSGLSTPTEATPFALGPALLAALATIPNHFTELGTGLFDLLGLEVSEPLADEMPAVNTGLFGTLVTRFDGAASAFAYMVFILLYFPCVATLGTIAREAGGRWAVFVAIWTTGVAYASATACYQFATFESHPIQSSIWLLLLSMSLIGVVLSLRVWGKRAIASS